MFSRLFARILYFACGNWYNFFFARMCVCENCILTSMVCHFCYKCIIPMCIQLSRVIAFVFHCEFKRSRFSLFFLLFLASPFVFDIISRDTKWIGQSNEKKNGCSCFFIHHLFYQFCDPISDLKQQQISIHCSFCCPLFLSQSN